MKALNSAGTYIKNSFDYALKGDYSKNFNVLGMILNVGIGLIPVVGQAADVRDLSYALTHTKENSTWGNIALIGLALIAFIPLVGDAAKNLKYAKYLGTAGDALKQLDNIGDVARGVSSSSDELADAARKVDSKIDEVAGDISKEKPVVVIGQTMGRVDPVAEEMSKLGFDVKTYKPQNFQSSYGNLLRKDVENNRSWLKYWTQEKGATVIDIGADPLKVSQGISSPFYDVELRSLYNNWEYQNVIKLDPDIN